MEPREPGDSGSAYVEQNTDKLFSLLQYQTPREIHGSTHQVESTDVEKRVKHSLSLEHEGNNSWVQNVRLSRSLSY